MRTQTKPRRHNLAGTCLLAVPAALSLHHAAQAQATIGTSQNMVVNLASYGAQSVTISQGVSLTATGWAAVSDTLPASLTNAGQVTDAAGTGIYLNAGGTLRNLGSIGGANGVRLNAAGAVNNAGAIQGADYGVLVNNATGQVQNVGSIAAGYDGVSLNKGGTVSNTGSIFGGHIGVYTGNALGVVSNSGQISARSGDAVSLYSGGSFTNTASGVLQGGYAGVYAGGNGASISNAGQISGPLFGAYLTGASSISNGGTMAGGVNGVRAIGPGAGLSNTGLIHGGQAGVKLAADGYVDDQGLITGGSIGVQMGKNGTLAIAAGGRVTGGVTGVFATAGDVLRNSGTISGGQYGIIANGAISLADNGVIDAGPGGTAISLHGGTSTITLDTGAVINGAINGGATASQIMLTGSGILGSNLSSFAAGSGLTVAQGARWVGEGQWQIAQLINNGVFTPGLMGAPLSLNGNFVQNAAATLRVVVTPQGISPFIISGTATLAGTLSYVLAPGTYTPAAENFLTASGGITGNFDQVSSTQAATQTPLLAVRALSGQIIIPQTFTISPQGAPLFAQASQAMALAAGNNGQAVLDHASSLTPSICPALNPVPGQTANIAQALAGGICAAGGWMQVSGTAFSLPGAYSSQGGGFLAGLDRPDIWGGRMGLAVGYESMNMRGNAGTAGLQTLRLGIYAAQPLGRFTLSADIMDGIVSQNTTRNAGAVAATASGSANVLEAALQVAAPFKLNDAAFTPAFGLRTTSVFTGVLDEVSATKAFALRANAATGTSVTTYLRLTITKSFVTGSSLIITPTLTLGVAATLGNPGARPRLTAQDGTNFTSSAAHLAPISGQFGAGLSLGRGAWTLDLQYDGEAGSNNLAQSLQAALRLSF